MAKKELQIENQIITNGGDDHISFWMLKEDYILWSDGELVVTDDKRFETFERFWNVECHGDSPGGESVSTNIVKLGDNQEIVIIGYNG